MQEIKDNIRTIERSRSVGVKDPCVAGVIKNVAGEYSAETPVRLARAIEITIKDKFTVEYTYSDDAVEDTVESYEGTEIEVEINKMAPGDHTMLFDTLYKNGYLVKAEGDKAKEVAFAFRAKQNNGKYEFFWYYCGKFERPELSYKTTEDKKTGQTVKLKGKFYARSKEDVIGGVRKKLYAIIVDESNLIQSDTTAAEAIENWFGAVQEYKDIPQVLESKKGTL